MVNGTQEGAAGDGSLRLQDTALPSHRPKPMPISLSYCLLHCGWDSNASDLPGFG